MHRQTLARLRDALRAGTISSAELTAHLLGRIETLDPALNSFISVCAEQALAQARAADALRSAGDQRALLGLPYACKDIFCSAGIRTSCGSRMLDNFIAPYDATAIERLREAGMILLGKTNLDEFAMGSSNETSWYGPVRNPWDTQRVPGGSSGGSACAVAARLVPAAIGTDTGGSIRQPAAFCGISGLKPTYGRVSRYGMVAFASSLDQGGPMAQSAEDLALLLGALAGFDARDSTSVDRPVEDYLAALDTPLAGLRVGVPSEYFSAGLDPAVGDTVQAALAQIERLGARLVDVHLPHAPLAIPAYYVIAPAEASSNLARYDGVRFGHRCADPTDLHDLYCRSRGEGFGREVKRRIMIGTYVLCAGYYEAFYLKAQRIRRLVQRDFKQAFNEVDVIAGPVSPVAPFRLGERVDDPLRMYMTDVYTVPASLAGLPAMSLPGGFADGLPVGLQLIGDHFTEGRLLAIAHRFQQATDWHTRVPAGY